MNNTMKCSSCGKEIVDDVDICPECGNKVSVEPVVESTNLNVNSKKSRKKSIIAFILALIPYLLLLFCFAFFEYCEELIPLAFFGMYCVSFGFPIFIISIIMALQSKNYIISKITLVLDAIPILIIIIVFIANFDQIIPNIKLWMEHHSY